MTTSQDQEAQKLLASRWSGPRLSGTWDTYSTKEAFTRTVVKHSNIFGFVHEKYSVFSSYPHVTVNKKDFWYLTNGGLN